MTKKPIIAICYDFDKTLTPTDMQGQGLLQACGYKTDEEITKFWERSNKYASDNNMDQNLSWMKNILEDAVGKTLINRENIVNFGKGITFYPGVEEWFKRINEYGEQRGIEVQHYVISCGLKEIIEGTSIHEEFKEIYASSFCYNEKNVPTWVSQVVNYTSKTQYLFRIEKNVPNLSDESINKKYLPEDIAIPFRNIIYIGDSTTDVPCMTLVNSRGGYSIGVYDDDKKWIKFIKC